MSEPTSLWTICPLSHVHDTQSFSCGKHSLDLYIRKWALRNQQDDIGRSFVAVQAGSIIVDGYYTISTSKVGKASLPAEEHLAPNYPVPVILLARMAVDSRCKGKGLGKKLLVDSLKRAQYVAEQVAVRGVEVDALDIEAERFYLAFGFKRLQDKPLHLYYPMQAIRRFGL